jgi:uncharacterized protein (DUF736 family)
MEEKLDDEGFEEVEAGGNSEQETGNAKPGTGNRPDFRIVQVERDKDGNAVYLNVGGMWKNTSKNGKTFYSMKIGQLKLLVFPNERK